MSDARIKRRDLQSNY